MRNNTDKSIFNSPFELGVRMVFLLLEIYPKKLDLHTLSYLDYALIYSGDLDGPDSLHTPVPLRGGEYLSRQQIIEQGLHLMSHRGFVGICYSKNGITYYAGDNASSLIGLMGGAYSRELRKRGKWVSKYLSNHTAKDLDDIFNKNGLTWGAHLLGGEKRGIT